MGVVLVQCVGEGGAHHVDEAGEEGEAGDVWGRVGYYAELDGGEVGEGDVVGEGGDGEGGVVEGGYISGEEVSMGG